MWIHQIHMFFVIVNIHAQQADRNQTDTHTPSAGFSASRNKKKQKQEIHEKSWARAKNENVSQNLSVLFPKPAS